MPCGFKSTSLKITKLQKCQRGYMLISLMLAIALMTIALLAVLPDVGQQIKRDREEELQHRGTAYMRAIQHFYRKFGRYPTRLEELESTENLRFIRKRYKDPVNRDPATGQERDFKLLHQTDITLTKTPVLQSTSDDPSSTEADPNSPGATSSPSGAVPSEQPVFGGGPILGVASTSKGKAIRVFHEKNHYNDWLFIYVSQVDRGGLLTGPVSPDSLTTENFGDLSPAQVSGPPGQLKAPSPGQPQSVPTQTPSPQNPGQTLPQE